MKCKLCNAQTTPFEDKELSKKFYHCDECEFIFLDNTFLVKVEDEKKQYDNHNNSIEDKGYVKMFEDFLDFFWEDIKIQTHHALDFGSGPGPVLYQLLQKRGVLAEHYDKFYQTKRVYEGKKYDLITSTEVFEHLDNPIEVLNMLTKHLQPQGTIALMTLFHTNKEAEFLKWWYRRDPTHISFFTPKSLQILAQKCGLELIKHDNKRIAVLQKK